MFVDDLLKFNRNINRICHSIVNGCDGCPLCDCDNECMRNSIKDDEIKRMVEVVEEWAKGHPTKMTTRAKEFKKRFPESEPDLICPQRLYGGDCKDYEKPYGTCYQCKSEFWNKEIEVEEEQKDD